MLKRLKHMKESLMCCAESQLCHLDTVDAQELGEVVDMIKDLEEAIYYCTITKAMEEKDNEHYYTEPMDYDRKYNRDLDRMDGRMYYDDRKNISEYVSNGNDDNGNASFSEYMLGMRDPKEGKSYNARKTYMESKEMHHDKAKQLKELEKYMQELTQDMVEMIEGASPEEKQYLEKRLSSLATKISQVNG